MPGIRPSRLFDQHKEEDAGDEGLEALVAVADDLLGLAADELVDHLGNLLRRVGLLHRQAQAHERKKTMRPQTTSSSSAKVSLMAVAGMGRMNTDGLENRGHGAAEEVVQQTSNCKCFRHENLSLSASGREITPAPGLFESFLSH